MSDNSKKAIDWLFILPAFGIYGYIAKQLDFIQDDAFITFRYVANFLHGHGLVYNIGEHIEGFTNFGWTIYLIFWGALGINYVYVAKVSGLAFGALSILFTFLVSRQIFGEKNRWFAIFPVYLVAINFSFAYWSPAGLETATFTFLAILSIYFYLKKSKLLPAALLLAVWVRPEGAMLAVIFIACEAVTNRNLPKYALTSSIIAFAFSIPFLAFKIYYYGSLLPNPFYAKTGFDFEQLRSGLEYAGQFFLHYGFLGIAVILALVQFKALSRAGITLALFVLIYAAYIVSVGGDVLKVHRFFLPVIGPSAILVSMELNRLLKGFSLKTANLLLFVLSILMFGLTYKLPHQEVSYYNQAEKVFVSKMDFLANEIKRTDSTDFSVAISTIGKFGFELLGHDVIDVLGLTDSTIARHSQAPIEGLQTTWKERKFNVEYLLKREPDYILFSTGSKPSAPAEKALFMHPAFFRSYLPIPFSFKTDPKQLMGQPIVAFKKVRPIVDSLDKVYPLQYVEYMKTALQTYSFYDYDRAITYFDSAMLVSPKPYNLYLLYEKSFALGKNGDLAGARSILNEIIGEDSFLVMAHRDAYSISRLDNDTAKASIHAEWIQKLAPWYWPEVKAVVDLQVAQNGQRK